MIRTYSYNVNPLKMAGCVPVIRLTLKSHHQDQLGLSLGAQVAQFKRWNYS
jgi:hypothetical protein